MSGGPDAPGASRPSAPSGALETRLTELEIKLSFCEDLIETLNTTVYRQQQQLDRLQQETRALREQLADTAPAGEPRMLRDELPPHY
jgi:SlyX protein